MTSVYCVRCKGKKQLGEGSLKQVMIGKKLKRSALRGRCPDCGTTIYRYIKKTSG